MLQHALVMFLFACFQSIMEMRPKEERYIALFQGLGGNASVSCSCNSVFKLIIILFRLFQQRLRLAFLLLLVPQLVEFYLVQRKYAYFSYCSIYICQNLFSCQLSLFYSASTTVGCNIVEKSLFTWPTHVLKQNFYSLPTAKYWPNDASHFRKQLQHHKYYFQGCSILSIAKAIYHQR